MSVGKDPLTWSFVKLFGLQISCDLHEFDGLPGSHAWRWKTAGIWRTRLLTKAQCCGIIASVVERSDRGEALAVDSQCCNFDESILVELLVDDGTELVKAVLWGEGLSAQVALGDLVCVNGKLNTNKNWDTDQESRELRIVRTYKLEDANEELLHWAQVMELKQAYYSATNKALDVSAESGQAIPSVGTQWEKLATIAFFSLCIDARAKQHVIDESPNAVRTKALLETLESILKQQKQCCAMEAVKITFKDYLNDPNQDPQSSNNGPSNGFSRIRTLQYVFRRLRQAGLLFLEDDAVDRHMLLSFEAVLKPALLQILRDSPKGRSIPDIADALLCQELFKCIPLQWIESGLERLEESQLIVHNKAFKLFYVK
ncbi:hypothetical protein CCR75_007382 [Bremia lactucae]|uniref:CST complex subunit Stn1 N-terminal domain-containing protein n=1 Tax=Bremia lactucae TaxID=4779 RepID=A0A976IBJ0_BRELC|nr:hypothetical protein CCR75_007382 [Bremia lactucae]